MASPIWMPTHDKFLHYTHITHTLHTHSAHTVSQCVLSEKPWACFLRTVSHHGSSLILCCEALTGGGFGVCGPKWPLRFYETRSPTLPHILLRVINYAGKPLALRGKVAATIWRQPQFLPKLFHICSPATALWIHCNAYEVSILRL